MVKRNRLNAWIFRARRRSSSPVMPPEAVPKSAPDSVDEQAQLCVSSEAAILDLAHADRRRVPVKPFPQGRQGVVQRWAQQRTCINLLDRVRPHPVETQRESLNRPPNLDAGAGTISVFRRARSHPDLQAPGFGEPVTDDFFKDLCVSLRAVRSTRRAASCTRRRRQKYRQAGTRRDEPGSRISRISARANPFLDSRIRIDRVSPGAEKETNMTLPSRRPSPSPP